MKYEFPSFLLRHIKLYLNHRELSGSSTLHIGNEFIIFLFFIIVCCCFVVGFFAGFFKNL